MKKEFICIVCPRGCHVTVDDDMNVSGNKCPRGKTYVETELKNPTRILTTTIKTVFNHQPRVSCKTDKPIPKNLLFEAMKVINDKIITQPLKIGDIVIEDILETGSNIILTKSCEIEEKR